MNDEPEPEEWGLPLWGAILFAIAFGSAGAFWIAVVLILFYR